jgi:hypothetical protein
MKGRQTLLFRPLKTLATFTAAAVLSVIAVPRHADAQTQRLKFDFEDTVTSTTDSVASAILNIVDASGTPTDLHGGAGSGVAGFGQALDFSSAASQGGTGLLTLTNLGTGLTMTNLLPLDRTTPKMFFQYKTQ